MEIRVPEVGESIVEAQIAKWLKRDGETVRRDEPLCEVETDKITLELNAEADGVLSIRAREGETVRIGAVIGTIEPSAGGTGTRPAAPAQQVGGGGEEKEAAEQPPLSPAVRKLAREKGIAAEKLAGSGKGGRVTMDDLFSRLQEEGEPDRETGDLERLLVPDRGGAGKGTPPERKAPTPPTEPAQAVRTEEAAPYQVRPADDPRTTRTPMTPIRRRIAERLLAARQQTAMLTTFNEVDMTRVNALRGRYRDQYKKRHGVALGIMPFFVKACVEALQEFPLVNARIDGGDILTHEYYDIGIAVSGEKGLVVPVLRDADTLHFAEIEAAIERFVEKVRTNRLAIADLEGGTFTISNGGVFGSLLSTPIINPPQSGVLGMHAIQERPVAVKGKVVIRPMMYLALSYDHRIIDGREAVGFLKKVKEYIEDPEEMLLEG